MLAFLKLIGRPVVRLLFSVEYHGVENVPLAGPVIIAGNHPSYLDPVLVALPVDRVIRFMGWDALFRVPILGWLIKQLGAFPVDIRRGKGEAAFLEARRVLDRGDALGIFPEGQRSERGPMGELRAGVARLAIETGAPIIPVTIAGAFRAWPKHKLLPKPAKIIVRFHRPIRLDAGAAEGRRHDREYHREVMNVVAASINRSLTPALRGVELWERWYRQPPSHIRTYELVPLAASAVATILALTRGGFGKAWLAVWLPCAAYYLYLFADLALIKPSRMAKWVRNSMPLWLILIWHDLLTRALGLPAGELRGVVAAGMVAAFFPFFWEDYYTLQKFVRGLVIVYYSALLLMNVSPQPLGYSVAIPTFVALFSVRFRTPFYRVISTALLLIMGLSLVLRASQIGWPLVFYAALGVGVLAYLQTFVNAAYDIRKEGSFTKSSNQTTPANSTG
jgi:1-acyl-sn-glycerol-3-phosphate acyltransferase